MKLLITDDEDITREGLKNAVKAMDLPIDKILLADDGTRGVDIALKEQPDIILSDIRMARMSGIDMVDALKDRLPDTAFIFMSGFSDREYLKEAIRLKAVSFIEKPIDLSELENSLKEAIRLIEDMRKARQSKLFHSKAAAGKLALLLTMPPEEAGPIDSELLKGDIGDAVKKNRHITVFLVKSADSLELLDENERKGISENFGLFLSASGSGEINIEKHDRFLIYHVFSPGKLTEKDILKYGNALKSALPEKGRYFISAGKCVSGMENAYRSYNQAVLLMQSSFFMDYGCIIIDSAEELLPAPKVLPDPSEAYLLSLLSGDREKIEKAEQEIARSFSDSRNLMPNQVRDIYYKLFSMVSYAYRKLSLNPGDEKDSSESLLSFVQECNTLKELKAALSDRSDKLLKAMAQEEPENPTVFSIKEYIGRNYSRENLSVKEISDYVHMSSTYICTLFKNETGQTLNQYITLFRMDKAKELLSDPKYKIADISGKVGYSDGNYFGKSFKKAVGMTPGEYRSRVLL
ncbi:MAG: response regulator [Lachnospiraceae bacterium]|nr:response regulator [Lachnospiraceae bacterium]